MTEDIRMADPATVRGDGQLESQVLHAFREAKSSGRPYPLYPPGSPGAAVIARWTQEARNGTLPPGYPIIDTSFMESAAAAAEKEAAAAEARAVAVEALFREPVVGLQPLTNLSAVRGRREYATAARDEAVKRRAAAIAFAEEARAAASAAPLRIRELEKELAEYKQSYDDLREDWLITRSIHVSEIEEVVAELTSELTKATSALLRVDTRELFYRGEHKYQMFLLELDTDFDSRDVAGAVEQMGKEGEPLFFKEIMTHITSPVEYAAAKATLSAPPAAPSSKKAAEMERRLKELADIIKRYDLRERLRASPEAQAVIKKIIHDYTPKIISIFSLPPEKSSTEKKLERCNVKVEECEAKAERYRKAMRIAVGIPNTPAPAPGPVTAAANTGELDLIDGEFFWVRNGNVYEYDQIEDKVGDFVGRLRADKSINIRAVEITVGGSRKTRGRKNKRRISRRIRG